MGASARAAATVPRPKIQVPRLPPNSLPRDRLLRRLSEPHNGAFASDAAAAEPLVIDVCAPAGYGKSTLLAMHAGGLRDRGTPAAWVSCDRHDNDPVQLWSAVLQSMAAELRRAAGTNDGAGPDAFAGMTPPQHEMEPAFLAEFVDAVDGLSAPITLILDDTHELVSPAVLSGLDDCCEACPVA